MKRVAKRWLNNERMQKYNTYNTLNNRLLFIKKVIATRKSYLKRNKNKKSWHLIVRILSNFLINIKNIVIFAV